MLPVHFFTVSTKKKKTATNNILLNVRCTKKLLHFACNMLHATCYIVNIHIFWLWNQRQMCSIDHNKEQSRLENEQFVFICVNVNSTNNLCEIFIWMRSLLMIFVAFQFYICMRIGKWTKIKNDTNEKSCQLEQKINLRIPRHLDTNIQFTNNNDTTQLRKLQF